MRKLSFCIFSFGLFAANLQAADQKEAYYNICTHDDGVKLDINEEGNAFKATVSGKALEAWLPENDSASIDCRLQGGSSMRPWWQCESSGKNGSNLKVKFWFGKDETHAFLEVLQAKETVRHFLLECSR